MSSSGLLVILVGSIILGSILAIRKKLLSNAFLIVAMAITALIMSQFFDVDLEILAADKILLWLSNHRVELVVVIFGLILGYTMGRYFRKLAFKGKKKKKEKQNEEEKREEDEKEESQRRPPFEYTMPSPRYFR